MEIYIGKSGKKTWPFTKEQITPMLDSGMVALTDLLCHEGLVGWIPVHQFLGVRPPLLISPRVTQSNHGLGEDSLCQSEKVRARLSSPSLDSTSLPLELV